MIKLGASGPNQITYGLRSLLIIGKNVFFSANNHNNVVQKYRKYQYCCLPSDIYYQHCLNLIDKPNIKLLTNVEVQEIQSGKNAQPFPSYIETSQGLIGTDIVVDTRTESIGNALLYQSFFGQEVELVEPIGSYDTVRLMCNMKADHQSISFYYLLPLNENRVLIEPTIFSRKVLPQHSLSMYSKRFITSRTSM